MKIKKIIKSSFEGEYRDNITLTMTCSKRIHLFKQTLSSFVNNCEDKLLISKIIVFDDSSSEDDRFEMERIVENSFPNVNIDFIYFNTIPTKYRHTYIMTYWFDMLKTNFVFHLEDDWFVLDKINLKDALQVLKDDWTIISVGFSQTLKEFPEEYLEKYKHSEYGKNKSIIYPRNTEYWQWPYIETEPIGAVMFYDTVRAREGSEDLDCNYWEYFLNYPPFGLQPSLMDVSKLKLIGNFELKDINDDTPIQMEGNYGVRVSKYFSSIHSLTRKVRHLGSHYVGESSAYDLNQSNR